MKQNTPRYVRFIRLMRLIFHVLWGVMQATVYPYFSRPTQQRMMKNWAMGVLEILKINVQCSGELPDHKVERALLVANHVSWLDICLLMATCPTQFVAKSEIRHWPVIGFLCKRVGTLFIVRAKRSDTMRINQEIDRVLSTGERVCIFPEGGTSDGTRIRHFHASLLQSAVDSDAYLYPVAIRYLDRLGNISKDAAYTDISMTDSLQKILNQPGIEAVINYNEPIDSKGRNRRELARRSEQAVANSLSLQIYHTESEKPSYLPGG